MTGAPLQPAPNPDAWFYGQFVRTQDALRAMVECIRPRAERQTVTLRAHAEYLCTHERADYRREGEALRLALDVLGE